MTLHDAFKSCRDTLIEYGITPGPRLEAALRPSPYIQDPKPPRHPLPRREPHPYESLDCYKTHRAGHHDCFVHGCWWCQNRESSYFYRRKDLKPPPL